MLDLDGEQFEAALHNIQVMRDLAYAAIDGIGIISDSTSDSVSNMREGLDDILHYVMDMMKQKVEDQITALEDMKDAYGELIDAKKKSLDATKTEESYEKKRSKQLKEIATLQARIDMLSLDDSREAQAERTKLLEQMAELQENLSDTQSDYAIDNQKDALDKMKDAYEEEKDDEIDDLRRPISSQQKLYEMAIDYIKEYWENDWDALKEELLQWNYDVGSDLEENLVSAWENATAAARKYGDFLSAMNALDDKSGSESSWSTENTVNEANRTFASKVSEMKQNSNKWMELQNSKDKDKDVKQKVLESLNDKIAAELSRDYADLIGGELRRGSDGVWYLPNGDKLYDASTFVQNSNNGNGNAVANKSNRVKDANNYFKEKVGEMKQNSAKWMELQNSNDPKKGDKQRDIDQRNVDIAADLSRKYRSLIGGNLWRGSNGVWYLPDGRKLYETSTFVYHRGGVVGDTGTLRDDEVLAKLQTGETVLTRKMWENAVEMVNNITKMTEAMSGAGMRNEWLSGSILRDMEGIRPNTVTNITNDTRPVEITFGDTIINGAAPGAVEKHREISREMMNEIARMIRKP